MRSTKASDPSMTEEEQNPAEKEVTRMSAMWSVNWRQCTEDVDDAFDVSDDAEWVKSGAMFAGPGAEAWANEWADIVRQCESGGPVADVTVKQRGTKAKGR